MAPIAHRAVAAWSTIGAIRDGKFLHVSAIHDAEALQQQQLAG
jgi:hypothetical protein